MTIFRRLDDSRQAYSSVVPGIKTRRPQGRTKGGAKAKKANRSFQGPSTAKNSPAKKELAVKSTSEPTAVTPGPTPVNQLVAVAVMSCGDRS